MGSWHMLIVSAAFALASVLWIVWRSHSRFTRRWRAALDAYAEREIARDPNRKLLPIRRADQRQEALKKRLVLASSKSAALEEKWDGTNMPRKFA